MKGYYFTFRSVTAAQRAQRLLTDAGIGARISRTPGALAANGCGYCLQVSAQRGPAAARALGTAGVQGVWLRAGEGFKEAGRDLF